jgi:hypothetical protein
MAFEAAAAAGGSFRRPSLEASSGAPPDLSALSQKVWQMSQSSGSVESGSGALGGPGDTPALRARIEGHERAALALQAEIDAGLRRLRVAQLAGAEQAAQQRQLKRFEDQFAEARDRLARVLGDSRLRRRQFSPVNAAPAPAPVAGGAASGSAAAGLRRLELVTLSEVDAAIIEERSQEALSIARESAALHKTQQDLRSLVGEQGEVLAKVEAHVDSAVARVEAGTKVLVEAQALQANYRCKCAVTVLLLAVVATAIAVPLVLTQQSGGTPPAAP